MLLWKSEQKYRSLIIKYASYLIIILTCLRNKDCPELHFYMSRIVRKTAFCICEKKDADQLRGNLNPKIQASSHILWQYSPVCVGPGRKPLRPVFSQRGSNKDPLNSIFIYIVICEIGIYRATRVVPESHRLFI